jgi:hypothetical protein
MRELRSSWSKLPATSSALGKQTPNPSATAYNFSPRAAILIRHVYRYTLIQAQTPAEQEKAKENLLRSISAISSAYERCGGPFFFGAKPSYADFHWFPWVHRLGVLHHYRGFSVPDTPEYAGTPRPLFSCAFVTLFPSYFLLLFASPFTRAFHQHFTAQSLPSAHCRVP